jgi:hypothetical protein
VGDERDQREGVTDDTDTEPDGESGNSNGHVGPLSPRGIAESFTANQQAYIDRQMADTRKVTLDRFKNSEAYQALVTKAKRADEFSRRADEVEGEGRTRIDALEAEVSRLKAERAGALSKAEQALIRAQSTAILSQRGVPAERIHDALVLMDKSDIKASLDEGIVTGAEDAVQALVESRPWLVGPGVAPRTTAAERPAPNLNAGRQGAPTTDEARIQAVMQEMAQRGMGRI